MKARIIVQKQDEERQEAGPSTGHIIVKHKTTLKEFITNFFATFKQKLIYIIVALAMVSIGATIPNIQQWRTRAAVGSATLTILPANSYLNTTSLYQIWLTTTKPVYFTHVEVMFNPDLVKLTQDLTRSTTVLSREIVKTTAAEANLTGKFVLALGVDPAQKATAPTGQFKLAEFYLAPNAPLNGQVATVAFGGASAIVGNDAGVMNLTPMNASLTLSLAPTATLTQAPTTTLAPSTTPTLPPPTNTPTTRPTNTLTPTIAPPTNTPTTRPTSTPTHTPVPTSTPTIAPPTSTPPPSTGFVITNVRATNITQTTATINWDLSDYGTGQVEYGKTTAYGMFSVPETSFTWKVHVQNLGNLTPNTLYHYRTLSSDRNGQSAVSGDYTFTTLAINQTPTQPSPTPILTQDVVSIQSAYIYRTFFNIPRLAVVATSSMAPNASLSVAGFGSLRYSSKRNIYSRNFWVIGTWPTSITVTSSKGGSATYPVTIR